MTHAPRLRPIVARRGYSVGAARLRVGWLAQLAMIAVTCGGLVVGTVAIADVLRALLRPL